MIDKDALQTQSLIGNKNMAELQLEEERFTSFEPMRFQHGYHEHPLFQMEALEALAGYLYPHNQCRFLAPDTRLDSEFMHYDLPRDGATLHDVFRNIEQPGAWVALYNVEKHPAYESLLNQIIAPLRPVIERHQGPLFNVGGFIFISAPPSVTPFHIDRENNFWLQLHGRKRISLFDHRDRAVVNAKAIDQFIVDRSLDAVRLDDAQVSKAHVYDMHAGDGVYFPSTTPHMTETDANWHKEGQAVSVSIGIVFYTQWTRRFARICQYNVVAQRLGLPVSYPQVGSIGGEIKGFLGKLLAAIKTKYRGYQPPPGSY